MSTFGPEREAQGTGGEPSEEELRAAYEAEIKKVRVEHVLLEHVVALVNLGMRRTGLSPGTESEQDPSQVRLAIESVRALMPLLEQSAPQHAGQIRSALSQLQLAFVKIGGQSAPAGEHATGSPTGPETAGPGEPSRSGQPASGPPKPGEPASGPPKPGEPGPAQRSGRLWVPGQ